MARSDETTHKKILPALILSAAVCTVSAPALSQVYQWKDPESGATRISNTAPSWFRHAYGENRNPRVQVFYYGVLVDDTSLPFEARMGLRSRTYIGRFLPALIPPTTLQARRP